MSTGDEYPAQAPCPALRGLRCPSQEGDGVQEGLMLTGAKAAGQQGRRPPSPHARHCRWEPGEKREPREQGQGCQPPHSVHGDEALVRRQCRRMKTGVALGLLSAASTVPLGHFQGEHDLPWVRGWQSERGMPESSGKIILRAHPDFLISSCFQNLRIMPVHGLYARFP